MWREVCGEEVSGEAAAEREAYGATPAPPTSIVNRCWEEMSGDLEAAAAGAEVCFEL